MSKKILIVITILGIGLSNLEAQDPVFSQFVNTPIQLNPALAGSTFSPRITLNYRNQWPAFSNAYVTYSASYDQYFMDANSGFGTLIMSDVAGDGIYKTNKFSLSYSYNFQFNRDFYVKGGLEAGLTQVSVDWDRLIFLDQIDPLRGPFDISGNPFPTDESRPFNLSRTYFDVAAGLVAFTKDFHAGISVKHLNAPDESLIDNNSNFGIVPVRLTIHAGTEFNFSTSYNKTSSMAFISPNIMFIKQGEFYQLNIGAFANFGAFFTGVWYRDTFANPDAVILMMGYRVKVVKIGYSYDVTISELSGNTGGAHELSVVVNFDTRKRRRAKNYLNCLKLFQF